MHLSAEVADSKAELKGFIIYLTPNANSEANASNFAKGPFVNIAVATLPTSDAAVKNYKVNLAPEVKNTVIVYKSKRVVAKFVNLKADKAGLAELSAAIEKAEQ